MPTGYVCHIFIIQVCISLNLKDQKCLSCEYVRLLFYIWGEIQAKSTWCGAFSWTTYMNGQEVESDTWSFIFSLYTTKCFCHPICKVFFVFRKWLDLVCGKKILKHLATYTEASYWISFGTWKESEQASVLCEKDSSNKNVNNEV